MSEQISARRGAQYWAGWVMSGLVIAFMILDFGMKLAALPVVIQASGSLGLPANADFARGLGVLLMVCTALYAAPPTAVLGAVLMTGYLGGSAAMHVRIGNPLFTHVLFGVYLGVLMWGGLWLRDPRIRALLPLRRAA